MPPVFGVTGATGAQVIGLGCEVLVTPHDGVFAAACAANATPDPESIPWLLLTAKDHVGDGVMKMVSSIQRLSTHGGKAPTGGCDSSHKGEQTRSHYTAVYYF